MTSEDVSSNILFNIVHVKLTPSTFLFLHKHFIKFRKHCQKMKRNATIWANVCTVTNKGLSFP